MKSSDYISDYDSDFEAQALATMTGASDYQAQTLATLASDYSDYASDFRLWGQRL